MCIFLFNPRFARIHLELWGSWVTAGASMWLSQGHASMSLWFVIPLLFVTAPSWPGSTAISGGMGKWNTLPLVPWMGFLALASINLLSPLSANTNDKLLPLWQAFRLSVYICNELKALYVHKEFKAEKSNGPFYIYPWRGCKQWFTDRDPRASQGVAAMMHGQYVVELNQGEFLHFWIDEQEDWFSKRKTSASTFLGISNLLLAWHDAPVPVNAV